MDEQIQNCLALLSADFFIQTRANGPTAKIGESSENTQIWQRQ